MKDNVSEESVGQADEAQTVAQLREAIKIERDQKVSGTTTAYLGPAFFMGRGLGTRLPVDFFTM